MAVVGPTGEPKSFTSTGFNVLVHVAGSGGVELDGYGCELDGCDPRGEA